MTQSPESINFKGGLLERDRREVTKRRRRLAEDRFRVIRPEQAYANFSEANRYVNSLDVPTLQHLGHLPNTFHGHLPKVASPDDVVSWQYGSHLDLIRMAMYAGRNFSGSLETVLEAQTSDLDAEEDEEEDTSETVSSLWGPYIDRLVEKKLKHLKVVMSPLTCFPAEYLFDEYFPSLLQKHFEFNSDTDDILYFIKEKMSDSYLRMILFDAYESLLQKDSYDLAHETTCQRLMLASSVVRNVTALKSSVFTGSGTFSPMRELLDLDLNPGDRVFMSLALGGGKSTALHVSQMEVAMQAMVNIYDNLRRLDLENFVQEQWESDASLLLEYFNAVESVTFSDNDELIKHIVKCKNIKEIDSNVLSPGDYEAYQTALNCRPTSTMQKKVVKVFWWLLKIKPFVERVRKAKKKGSWTGILTEMTLSLDSPRLSASQIPYVTLLDVVNFIEEWKQLRHNDDGLSAVVYSTLPEYFKENEYHRLNVVHVSNNEELDAFISSYTLYDLDSSTIQALNSNNVSGLSKDEALLMTIPSPVVTAQRTSVNSTMFYGRDMQLRTAIFDERSSAAPYFVSIDSLAFSWEIFTQLYGDDFFARAYREEVTFDALSLRQKVFGALYQHMKNVLQQMCEKGKSTRKLELLLEPVLQLAQNATRVSSDNTLQILHSHFDMEIIENGDRELIDDRHPGLQKLCLAASRTVVDSTFEIINQLKTFEERQNEERQRIEEQAAAAKEVDAIAESLDIS